MVTTCLRVVINEINQNLLALGMDRPNDVQVAVVVVRIEWRINLNRLVGCNIDDNYICREKIRVQTSQQSHHRKSCGSWYYCDQKRRFSRHSVLNFVFYNRVGSMYVTHV